MNFTVISYTDSSKRYKRLTGVSEVFLVRDNWDDYGFKTTFALVYFDEEGERYEVGKVKIMLAGMPAGYVAIDDKFESLGPGYGSLGQDQSYYETLLELAEPVRVAILGGLRDVVWDEAIRAELQDDDAYETSLTRSVGGARFYKLRSIIQEQSTLTAFNFAYRFPYGGEKVVVRVDPDSTPPSNIHVVIGRNGVGKTTLLTSISALLRNGRDKRFGALKFEDDPDASPKDQFANLITVAFSAFDNFDPPPRSTSGKLRSRKAGTRSGIDYTYVGLKKRLRVGDERATGNKSEADLQKDFVESTLQCLRSASRPRWQEAMRILEADPLFAGLGLSLLAELDAETVGNRAEEIFDTASSGHKIVLLTLTRLAELVSERTLVLIDEPEAHLHPPLVMALVRAISNLLAQRNGVAILATHSPVVVQEVPASCVTLLFRAGDEVRAERPEIETFAENLGTLTREIFRVEVTESGHHALITEVAQTAGSLENLLGTFSDQIGAEGRALARAILRAAN
ncbi:ATP-dependent nuclease [Marinobacter segnicrescens]|uniref:ATP-dependent nuclease n=1 Tax=Marinobacter segnicrescens TaxID=430453 RepID=UPI003A909188